MNAQVEALCKILKLDKKFYANHDFSKLGIGRLLPWGTRKDERVKFSNGFNPIIGVIARSLNGKGLVLETEPIQDKKIPVDTMLNEDIIQNLFSSGMYEGMHSSKLLQYLPLSDNRESIGEILLGEFVVNLMDMKNHEEIIELFSETEPNNLYEKVVFDLLSTTDGKSKSVKRLYQFYNANEYRKLFYQDVHNLQYDKAYFYDHIAELLQFYYFTYVTQLLMRVSDTEGINENGMVPLYFTVEDESVSRSRQAIRNGYQVVFEHGRTLLDDIDVLNYLNALIPSDQRFYWKSEIYADTFPYKEQLHQNLQEFVPILFEQLQLIDNSITKEVETQYSISTLKDSISTLRALLHERSKTNASGSQSSRYSRGFREIAKQGYIRQHGRLGYTFALNDRTILMLVTAIVGHGKRTVGDVFKALGERGLQFDSISKSHVIDLFEQANIIEKLSDSGDAQYVRGVL